MTNILKPTLGKIIATIILLLIVWISVEYSLNLILMEVVLLLFFPVTGMYFLNENAPPAWIGFIISILWSYFLVCIFTHIINKLRNTGEKL